MPTETATTDPASLVRLVPDAKEANALRVSHRIEFSERLDRHDRRHLVTEEALDRWYAVRPTVNRAARIQRDHGAPVSTRLERP